MRAQNLAPTGFTSCGQPTRADLEEPRQRAAVGGPSLLLGGHADGFHAVSNRKKRSCKYIDFTALLTSQVLQPLDGIATSNYFKLLPVTLVDGGGVRIEGYHDKKHSVRKQIVSVSARRLKSMETSIESALIIKKHYTKIVKAV
ncbi:hypothetical protein Plhal304r1_c004g0018061 [Plasmopara halstedii]